MARGAGCGVGRDRGAAGRERAAARSARAHRRSAGRAARGLGADVVRSCRAAAPGRGSALVAGGQDRAVPLAVRRPGRRVRAAVAERPDGEVGMVARCGWRVGELEAPGPRLRAAHGCGDRTSSGRRRLGRAVPVAAQRPLPVAGVRLRWWLVGARRARLPRRVPAVRAAGGVGTLPLRRWRARVGVLLRSCPGGRCPQGGRGDAATGDGISGRDRPVELRPVVPVAGRDAEGLVREPDRTSAARRLPQARHDSVPRPDHARPVRGPVGVPFRRAVGEPGGAERDRGVGASACRSAARRSIGSRPATSTRPRRWCTRRWRGCCRSSGSDCRHG